MSVETNTYYLNPRGGTQWLSIKAPDKPLVVKRVNIEGFYIDDEIYYAETLCFVYDLETPVPVNRLSVFVDGTLLPIISEERIVNHDQRITFSVRTNQYVGG